MHVTIWVASGKVCDAVSGRGKAGWWAGARRDSGRGKVGRDKPSPYHTQVRAECRAGASPALTIPKSERK
jgi:hypothetical protein